MTKTAQIDTILMDLRRGYVNAKVAKNDMVTSLMVQGLKLFHAERLGNDDAGYQAAQADIATLNASLPAH